MKNSEEKSWIVIAVIMAAILLFIISTTTSCSPPNNRYVICSHNRCDTVNSYCSIAYGGVSYHKNDSEEVVILGSYTVTKLK